jgi:hypothetical protein
MNRVGRQRFGRSDAEIRTTPVTGPGQLLTCADVLQAIALSGDDAPGVPAGVLVGFDAPALNDNDELQEKGERNAIYGRCRGRHAEGFWAAQAFGLDWAYEPYVRHPIWEMRLRGGAEHRRR